MSLQTRRRCLQTLMKICGEYVILPNAYIIPQSKILKLGNSPTSSSDLSEAWPGMDEEDKAVAIRVMRYHESDDIRGVKKVRYFELLSLHDRS